jgi:hypothetical protein
MAINDSRATLEVFGSAENRNAKGSTTRIQAGAEEIFGRHDAGVTTAGMLNSPPE